MLGGEQQFMEQGGREAGAALARSALLGRELRTGSAGREKVRRCGTAAGAGYVNVPRTRRSLAEPARQDLGQPRIDFYAELSGLYQQRSSQTQAIVDQLDGSGGGYAPVIDHSRVAEFNLALSEQFAVMGTAQYWDDFSQNLGADFGELSALYDTVAGQNANLAQGHEQQALAAHNAYDHGLLVFDGVIQDQTFIYDPLGNLTERIDGAVDMLETFQYDQLNRITGHGRSGQGAEFYELADLASIGYQYDALGNITHRTDVGSYSYGAQAGPHAVTAVSGSEAYHKNTTYTYDANGNQTGGDGRSLQWASFNKPTTISRAGTTVTMDYGPERQLYRQVENDGSSTKTTTYVGGIYEKEVAGGQVAHRYHIAVAGEVMAVLVDQTEELPEAHYFHRDHQNSIVAVSDKNGYVIERYTYDAFGERHRAVAANDPLGNLVNAVTDRGYTGHMHMAGIGLINMNGRLFDATIGRFISADPFIQAPLLSQSYNRYSYVLNNPLKLVDPSGYLFGFLKKLFKKVKKIVKKVVNVVRDVVKKVASFVKTYWRPILAITVAVVAPYAIAAVSTLTTTSVTTLAISGGLSGFVATGSLKGALIGAATGAAFAGVGQSFGNLKASSALTKVKDIGPHTVSAGLNAAGRVAKTLAHGVVGGMSTAVSGGKFTKGFLSAGVTQAFAGPINDIDGFAGDQFARVAGAAGVGGLTSELSGGKFADGAILGAYSRWFNDEMHVSFGGKASDWVRRAWNRITGQEVIANGGSFGLAVTVPNVGISRNGITLEGEFDVVGFLEVDLPGGSESSFDYGIGKTKGFSIGWSSASSAQQIAGVGSKLDFQYGPLGGSLTLGTNGNFGANIDFLSRGLQVSGTPTATAVYSFRNGRKYGWNE